MIKERIAANIKQYDEYIRKNGPARDYTVFEVLAIQDGGFADQEDPICTALKYAYIKGYKRANEDRRERTRKNKKGPR